MSSTLVDQEGVSATEKSKMSNHFLLAASKFPPTVTRSHREGKLSFAFTQHQLIFTSSTRQSYKLTRPPKRSRLFVGTLCVDTYLCPSHDTSEISPVRAEGLCSWYSDTVHPLCSYPKTLSQPRGRLPLQ